MSAQVGARRTLSPQPKAFAASDVRIRPTAESDGALAVNCRLRARRAPSGGLGASRLPRASTAEPEVVSRTRRPRTRRGGTTPSPVSTRRRPRSAKGVFGHVAENVVSRSIFFLRNCGGDFAQNFRDARSGRDLATINRRAPQRPQRRRSESFSQTGAPSSRHSARRFARARRLAAGPRVA